MKRLILCKRGEVFVDWNECSGFVINFGAKLNLKA